MTFTDPTTFHNASFCLTPTMATDKSYAEKVESVSSTSDQHLEDAGRSQSTAQEITELSNIEATAASKAAWIISITVSLGGFLFGYDTVSYTTMA